ncbi:MAG: hypothetical protein GY757_23420, partial [bacterium]|nr:hypothetical protein [bacterium]
MNKIYLAFLLLGRIRKVAGLLVCLLLLLPIITGTMGLFPGVVTNQANAQEPNAFTHKDKPFFPIGLWGDVYPGGGRGTDNMSELASWGFNTLTEKIYFHTDNSPTDASGNIRVDVVNDMRNKILVTLDKAEK